MIEVIQGDCREVLAGMEAESVQCVVTSPPYWYQRLYPGLLLIWGGKADCEHEWGATARPVAQGGQSDFSTSGLKRDGRSEESRTTTLTQNAKELRRQAPESAGQFCQRCGAWRGSLGLEPTVELYVEHIVEVFGAVRRVLRKDGTLWLNMGHSYSAASTHKGKNKAGPMDSGASLKAYKGAGAEFSDGLAGKQLIGVPWRLAFAFQGFAVVPFSRFGQWADMLAEARAKQDWEAVLLVENMLRAQDLLGALQGQGWWLRSAIVWAKGLSFCPTYSGSVMPESCRDRPTSAYEMVFLLTKSARYYYDADAVREASIGPPQSGGISAGDYDTRKWVDRSDGLSRPPVTMQNRQYNPAGRNLRNVWAINPQSFPLAHFATFPEALVEPCVKAGSSPKACGECGAPWERVVSEATGGAKGQAWLDHEHDAERGAAKTISSKGYVSGRTTGWRPTCEHDYENENEQGRCVVLDPFGGGSGRVGLVCKRLGRDAVLIELSGEYCDMTRKRCAQDVTQELFA